jgi:hypothetical protein
MDPHQHAMPFTAGPKDLAAAQCNGGAVSDPHDVVAAIVKAAVGGAQHGA